jgi:hypothetical protein
MTNASGMAQLVTKEKKLKMSDALNNIYPPPAFL